MEGIDGRKVSTVPYSGFLAVVGLCGMAAACAGSSAGPSRTVVQEPDVPPVVTITGLGADPTALHIYAKDVATFVNNDNKPHDIRPDVRLNLNNAGCNVVGVGLLNPGESRKEANLQPSGFVCY